MFKAYSSQSQRYFLQFVGLIIIAISCFFLVNWPYSPRNEYSPDVLSKTIAYLQLTAPNSPVFLYPNDQPTTSVSGDVAYSRDITEYLKHARPGRYRRAWGKAEIEIVVVKGFFSADTKLRRSLLQDLPLQEFIERDMVGQPESNVGCVAINFQQFGWAAGGYVLVDPALLSLNEMFVKECVLAAFDYLDGFPVPGNTFDYKVIPEQAVRSAAIDYLRICAYRGTSDAKPAVRSRYGISSLPSFKCALDELDKQLAGVRKLH